MKKIKSIFINDLHIAIKDPISLWISFAPILISILIVVLSPGVSDSSLSIAITDADPAMIEYFEQVAKIEVYKTKAQVEERVLKRDHLIGILSKEDNYQILAQGNEIGNIEELAKIILNLYLRDADINKSYSELYTFGEKISPIKKSLSAAILIMITILSGMLIASGIIDDKSDNTINAMNVSTVSKFEYIIGKSIIGIAMLIFSSITSLLILGLADINWLQLFLILISTSIIAIIMGFLMGLTSSDIIEAAASIKILMLPMFVSILVEELTSAKWHYTVYWSPFYWNYKAIKDLIQNNYISWNLVSLNLVLAITVSLLVYFLSKNKIKEGLS